jgi:2-polyprenyl-6-hydroxyphenyl methylase/3-demethylubiquinone-9 3-methyltransferase
MQKAENFDQDELKNFNELSHKWWDLDGEFKALHQINPFRLKFMQQWQTLENKTIVDIGCGGGILSESLAMSGANVTGLDLAEDVLMTAKLHALDNELNVNYQLISAEAFAQQNPNYAEIVTCMEMLEHVPNPASIIEAASKMLKPGGWLFLSTLNRNFKSKLLAVDLAEKVLNLVPKGTHNPEKFLKPSELDEICRQHDLHLQDTAGIEYNPLLNRYGLTNDLSINYLMAFRKS